MMTLVVVVVVYLIISIAVGSAAKARGRDGFGWFLLSLIVSPILALLLLIAFPVRDSSQAGGEIYTTGTSPMTPHSALRRAVGIILAAALIAFLIGRLLSWY
jgi:ABC-type sulfate transport system permease component